MGVITPENMKVFTASSNHCLSDGLDKINKVPILINFVSAANSNEYKFSLCSRHA